METSKKIIFNTILFLIFSNLTYGSDLDIKEVARNLSEDVNEIKNSELGVPFILKLYNNFMYLPGHVDLQKSIHSMLLKLESKINDIFSGLDFAKSIIQNIVELKNISLSSALTPCFRKDSSQLVVDTSFIGNKTVLHSLGSRYVLDKMKKNMGTSSAAVQRQYIISKSEIEGLQYSPFYLCNDCDETILWENYMYRRKHQRKNVVLILDNGGSINNAQLQILKTTAKKLISFLVKDDRIAVVTINSNCTYFRYNCDYSKELMDIVQLEHVNVSFKRALNNYIDTISADSGATNHVLGIKKGLDIISKNANLIVNETVMVLYVSRGLLSSLMEPRIVLDVIAKFMDENNITLVINTCAITGDFKPVMYEPQFLRDMAEQNFKKYNISHKPSPFSKTGVMLKVNSSRSVSFAVNQFYSIFSSKLNFDVDKRISLPTWDATSRGLTISFTRGVLMENNFFLLGVDVYFTNLVEDIMYYSSNQDESYAFLMDIDGKILIHPSFLRPMPLNHQTSFVDLEHFEKIPDIQILREKLISEQKGIYDSFRQNSTNVVKYIWNRVGNYYVLCIVTNTKYGNSHKSYKSRWFQSSSKSKFLYHNLEDYQLCRHINYLATTDVASLYLSSSCFQSPFTASRTIEDKLTSQGYLAYLKDDTRLLANPGLKDEVRDEVSALSHVLDFLRKKQLSSQISKYVVRRYASSYTGVLQMFPGSVVRQGLQPTKRPWFLKALQHREKVTLIPPYLDKGGAGYIVTLAYATSQLVVALDVTYGYMLKLLLSHMPACLSKKTTCFLIDDQGYIIYHPNLTDVNGGRPIVEQQHIVHKESLVFNDVLNHKHFIKKMLCNNYGDNTIQRYYRLNTSFTDVLVNFGPGEHCVTYQITSVPHTNIFIGVVNVSCDFPTTSFFCPCSIVDRLCLNCNRMEQKECECPCECPLEDEHNVCDDAAYKNMTNNPACTWYSDESSLETSFTIETDNNLETCFPISCQSQKLFLDCLGLVGCEWCRYDMDGNHLRKPFCATVNTCFNGFFDITTSYTENIAADSEYSPVGPILGSIIAMCILFISLFICYRSYTNPLTERLYLSSTQDQLRMSDLNINDTFHDLGNYRDKLLQEDSPKVISPYCMASTYKQPPLAADSDHGYSTMTPHDESEHLSLAPVEVESTEDDIMSDSTSIHTSISAKDGSHVVSPMYTKISNKNCIIVPVTVHRNMEKT